MTPSLNLVIPTWILMFLFYAASQACADDSLIAEVSVRNDQGSVICSLFNSSEGFPKEDSKAVAKVLAKPKNKRATCKFNSVPSGEYAIFAFQDENENGKLDRNWIGMPKEGVGTSGKGGSSFGPPQFEDAKFKYEGKSKLVEIAIRYL